MVGASHWAYLAFTLFFLLPLMGSSVSGLFLGTVMSCPPEIGFFSSLSSFLSSIDFWREGIDT